MAINCCVQGQSVRNRYLRIECNGLQCLVLSLFCLLPRVCIGNELPNILFAISDDQSAMHCGAYGDRSIRTPAFDRIAREGVMFERAFCTSPSCSPSRSSILTGRPIWQLKEAGNLFGILDSGFRTFTTELRAGGYQLGATGKTWGPGKTRGIALYDSSSGGSRNSLFGKNHSSIKLVKTIPGISNIDYASNFEKFFENRDPDRPFFFWYGGVEPHQRYDAGRWKSKGKKLSTVDVPPFLPDNQETAGEFLDYGLEIEHFDQHLQRMIQVLERAGELDNTIVVVTSDHGNPMPRSKCNLYDSGTMVPLAIRWPGQVKPNRKVKSFVSLVDIAPTLLSAAKRKIPLEMSGKNLLTLGTENDPQTQRDFVVTAFERHIICRQKGVGYPMRCIRTDQFALIRNYEPARWPAGDPDFISSHQGYFGDCDQGATKDWILQNANTNQGNAHFRVCFGRRPSHELYDVQKDPNQLVNLAHLPEYQNTLRHLESRLNQYLKNQGDPRSMGRSPWDTYPFTDTRIFQHSNWEREGFPLKLPEQSRKTGKN